MDSKLRTIIDGVADVAMKVGPLLGGNAPAAVALAGSVVALAKHVEQTFGDEVGPQLPAEREKIEAEIRSYVGETADMLRGQPKTE